MWARCLNHELRGYIFHESHNYGAHDGAIPMDARPFERFNLTIDGVVVKLRQTMSGVEFYHKIKPYSQELALEITGWLHYLSFQPSLYCSVKPNPPMLKFRGNITDYPLGVHPNYIMQIWNWDEEIQVKSEKFHRIVVHTANNFAYHHCKFKLSRYNIVIRRYQMEAYLKHPTIRKGVLEGIIHFIIKGNHPPITKGLNCNWQAIYENLMILRYWGEDVRLIFSDLDEYFYFPSSNLLEVNRFNYYYSRVLYFRSNAYCENCPAHGHGFGKSFFSTHNFRKSKNHQEILGKNIIDPNRVCCMYVHHANHAGRTSWMNITNGFILHFPNLFKDRVPVNLSDPNVESLDMNPMKSCEPHLYHAKFKTSNHHVIHGNPSEQIPHPTAPQEPLPVSHDASQNKQQHPFPGIRTIVVNPSFQSNKEKSPSAMDPALTILSLRRKLPTTFSAANQNNDVSRLSDISSTPRLTLMVDYSLVSYFYSFFLLILLFVLFYLQRRIFWK